MAEEQKETKKTEVTLEEVVPTLFIALGGTGAQVLWRIRRRILNTLWGVQGSSIRLESLTEFPFAEFLQIDLSAYETEQGKAQQSDLLAGKIRFKESEKLVKKLDLNEYTKSEEALDCHPLIKEWFPLSRKTINELNIDPEKGAGQIRAISRLFFFDKYQEIKSAIRTKTDSLLDNVGSDLAQKRLGLTVKRGALKIVVIASTAGGTGSGSFLDLGYLAAWLGRENANDEVTTNLVLLLPSGYKGAGLTRTEANTYAALMELETCMRQGSRFIKQWAVGEEPKLSNSPYSDVYFIDTANLAGAKTGDVKDIYEMVADSLFEDFSNGDFANRKRSISVNQNQYKVVPYEMPLPRETYGNMNFTFSRGYSSFGQATIDIHLEQKKNVVLFRQVNGMLKAFFGVAVDDPKTNTPTEGERDDILAKRMYLALDNDIIEYDFVTRNELFQKGVERTTYPLVTELLRDNGISKLDDIEKRIVDRFEEIRTGGNYKEWPGKIAQAISQINHDTFKAVESGSGLHEESIRKRKTELLTELLDPGPEHGLIKGLWMRVDNKERGGLDYTIELIRRIKDKLENANTGIVKALEQNAKWYSDLSGLLKNEETSKLQEHLQQAIGKLLGAQAQSELKLKQISEAVRLYVRYHLYAAASREAAQLVRALSDSLGRQQGTDVEGAPIWGGFIGRLEEGRNLVRSIIANAEDQIERTNEALKQEHAMYFVLQAPRTRIDELELLPRAQARQWAEEAFQDLGGTEQLFTMLNDEEGCAELLGKLRNRALKLIGADEQTDEENPLFAALEQHPNLPQLFTDFLQRAMPWVPAKVGRYLKPQNPHDQYKCLIGVKDSEKFKARYGTLLLKRLPTVTMITEKELGFVEIDAPGKLVCYTELSGLPLPSLRFLDQWYVSYRSEDKIPVHTHRLTSTFVHARELSLDELASRAEDFKLFVQAVALGVLKRTQKGEDAGIYSVTRRGRVQAVGDEKKLRLVGIPEAYRPIISEQVNADLDQLASADQLAMWIALLAEYSVSVYPEAKYRFDGTDDYRKFLPTLMCENLVEEWTRRLERKIGQGSTERLVRAAEGLLRDWTDEVPDSTSDVYPYEVNVQLVKPKRVLRKEVFQPNWSLGGSENLASCSRCGAQIDVKYKLCPHCGNQRNAEKVSAPPAPPMFRPYKVAIDGKSSGPFDWKQLFEMATTGQLTLSTKVWRSPMPSWQTVGEIDELLLLVANDEPPLFEDDEPPLG